MPRNPSSAWSAASAAARARSPRRSPAAARSVIVGDALGHEALRQPDISEQVVAPLGAGRARRRRARCDRRSSAGIVFADAGRDVTGLEALVHPVDRAAHRARRSRRPGPTPRSRLIVLDAAVMLEAGWNDVCDRLVYVDAPREVRLRRVAEQRGWTREGGGGARSGPAALDREGGPCRSCAGQLRLAWSTWSARSTTCCAAGD